MATTVVQYLCQSGWSEYIYYIDLLYGMMQCWDGTRLCDACALSQTSSLSSFEKMMMAVKVEGPPGRSDLVHESTPITAVDSSGQANREKRESSWFNFISHLEQPLAPRSRDQERQGHPKQVPLDDPHYLHRMAGSSGGAQGTDANVCSSSLCQWDHF